jgi:hypothetical protein
LILDDEGCIDCDNSVRALVSSDKIANGIEGRDARRDATTSDALGVALERGGAGVILLALPREIDSDERCDGTSSSWLT